MVGSQVKIWFVVVYQLSGDFRLFQPMLQTMPLHDLQLEIANVSPPRNAPPLLFLYRYSLQSSSLLGELTES